MVSLEAAHANEARLLKYLEEKGIQHERFTHPVVLTVDEQANHVKATDGALAKNLLLKDKKGRLILVCARTSTTVDLKLLSQRLGMGKGGLRMAPLENLSAVLQVPEGSVTPLAIFHESARNLPLLLDQGFQSHAKILVHPLVNDSTIALQRDAFEELLTSLGREANYVDLEAVVVVGKDQPPDLAHLLQGSVTEASPASNGTPHSAPAAAGAATAAAATATAVAQPAALAGGGGALAAKGPQASKGAQKGAAGGVLETDPSVAAVAASKRGPPGDDVATCAERILGLLKRLPPPSGAGGANSTPEAQGAPEALSFVEMEELQHTLVMFKNAAYTQGFSAAKACQAPKVW